MLEVVLLQLEHDATHQVHPDGWSVRHLGHNAVEARSDGDDGSADVASQDGRVAMEDVNSDGPSVEFLDCNVGLCREADVLGGESRGIRQGQGGAGFNHLGALDQLAYFRDLLVTLTDDRKGRESLAEGEPGSPRLIGAEDIIDKAGGGHRGIRHGERDVGGSCAFGEEGVEDAILTVLGGLHQEGVDLGEIGLRGNTAVVEEAIAQGLAMLVGKRLDSTFTVELETGGMVRGEGRLDGVDSSGEGSVAESGPSDSKGSHAVRLDAVHPSGQLAGGDGARVSDGGDRHSRGAIPDVGRGRTPPLQDRVVNRLDSGIRRGVSGGQERIVETVQGVTAARISGDGRDCHGSGERHDEASAELSDVGVTNGMRSCT